MTNQFIHPSIHPVLHPSTPFHYFTSLHCVESFGFFPIFILSEFVSKMFEPQSKIGKVHSLLGVLGFQDQGDRLILRHKYISEVELFHANIGYQAQQYYCSYHIILIIVFLRGIPPIHRTRFREHSSIRLPFRHAARLLSVA
jgi:hypothetical protein